MALLTIQQTVPDYADWRAVYDGLAEVRRDWGVIAETVHRLADAPDTVLVALQFATVAQARGFLTNRAHRAALRRAGVEGSPRVEIYD